MSDFMHFDNNFLPLGVVLPTVSDTIPAGWLLCDGSEVSRETYAALFSAIGTTYGEGDSSTTFNIPDMRNRVAVGNFYKTFKTYEAYSSSSNTIRLKTAPELTLFSIGDSISYGGETRTITAISGSQTSEYYTIKMNSSLGVDIIANKDIALISKTGKTGGEMTHTLTVNEMPTHSHTMVFYTETSARQYQSFSTNGKDNATQSQTTSTTGGSQAHNNMPPYITMNYIIYAGV